MKPITRLFLFLALTVTVASALPVSSFAGGAPPAPLQAVATSGPSHDSWVGGVGAVGCGFGIRFGGFGNPGGVAATVIFCLIALADGIMAK